MTCIGVPEIVQGWFITGPINCAKSFLVLLIASLLGQDGNNYTGSLPPNYLISPPRADPQAAQPVLSALCGCKAAMPKEVLSDANLHPVTTKQLISGPDVNISGRDNHSKRQDVNSFGVTWKVISQGNQSVRCSYSPEDGLGGKIVEVQPQYAFVEDPDAHNPRQRRADPTLSRRALAGAFNAEMLAWIIGLRHTLGADCVHGRVLLPQPAAIRMVQADREVADAPPKSLLEILSGICKHVTKAADASTYMAVKQAVGSRYDETAWTAAGFGVKSKRQIRQKANKEKKTPKLHFDYFFAPLLDEHGRHTASGIVALK